MIFARLSVAGKFAPMSGEDWGAHFLDPAVDDSVPEEVRKLFEAARGVLAYGYYFYPLYALAGEQLYRVAEAVVSAKRALLGAPKKLSFQNKIKFLLERNVISEEGFQMWDAVRMMRNNISHPRRQAILPPGAVAAMLGRVAEMINSLFEYGALPTAGAGKAARPSGYRRPSDVARYGPTWQACFRRCAELRPRP